jgi:hypothetical protein
MSRWVDYLADQGITTGPLFREVLRSGKVATSETRKKRGATKRGDYLRPQIVNDRVKLWFPAAGLKTDGRPVSSHSLRAGGATDLEMNGSTDEEFEEAGRWKKGSRIPRERYVRPVKNAKADPFKKVPTHTQEARRRSDPDGARGPYGAHGPLALLSSGVRHCDRVVTVG